MLETRRLAAVAAFLGVAAILTCADVWGEPRLDRELKAFHRGDDRPHKPAADKALPDEPERSRFIDMPLAVYQPDKGDALFALQVKAKLPDAPVRPIDYLVVVDTSASKAMGPLAIAHKIAEALAGKLAAADRMSLWTANLKPKDLSRGFKPAKEALEAVKELAKEIPLGAVDLKKTLTETLASFEVKESRQRVLLFLGDGKSVANPLDVRDRAELCDIMVKKQVGFFAVPLGVRIDSQNLHSIIGSTGGKAVRHGMGEKIEDLVARLQKEIAQPILYNVAFSLPETAREVLPSKLPPLRRDAAALVVGKLPRDTKTLSYTLSGTVAGKEGRFDATFKVPAADVEHFFLVGVHRQWKAGADRPALLQADRALAYAYEQTQLALEDLLAKGEMALEHNKLDAAAKLFQQAQQFAPHSARAKGGLALVENMRAGKKSRADMLKELRMDAAKREVMRLKDGKRKIVVLADGDEKEEKLPAGVDPGDPLDDVKARRAIAEQQANALVNEAVRQANRLVRTNPDEAYELLKRTLDGVKGNADLEGRVVAALTARLSQAMGSVARVGNTVKRDQAEGLALRAAADARLDIRRTETLAQDRVRERLRVFHNLMDQAREEEAHRQALSIRNDMVNQGQVVPAAVTYGVQSSLNGYHLREVQELRRVREERFLATMLEVERSHVPFPDEPPVEFPSAAVIRRITRGQFDNWGDFSKYRTGRYAVTSFGSDVPSRLFELQNLLNKTIDYGGLDDPKATLIDELDRLARVYRVTFDVNEKAFKYEMLNDVLKTEIANPNAIPPMKTTLGTVLKKILARIGVPSGAMYLIRRDVIEITTGTFATAEKAVRVYPVADLVTPIPNAFNQNAVQQTGSILGQFGQQGAVGLGGGLALGALGALGGALGALGALGGLGALGALGGGLGALGALGGGLGALGALGGALGALGGALGALGGGALGALGAMVGGAMLGGAAGLMAGGAAGLQAGQFNFMGNANLGVGGGQAGFTGGQLGQLGNLGGQFGLQGGTQEQLLITLIRQVVGRPKDWLPQYNPITGQPLNPLDDEKADGAGALNGDNNQLGYYPPSLALVVKAPSLIHTRASSLIITGAGAAGAGDKLVLADDDRGGRILVNGGRPRINVAGDGDEREKRKKMDPKEVWQNALVKGKQEPGLIIATADFLALNQKFDHAAEFLKANLRQGVVVKPWVFKSLAIALRESGGSAEEIERAEVSTADFEPLDGQGCLQAARALAEDKNYDRALAFCKQAAALEPGLPQAYADAARYADMAKDAPAMQWAVGHLVRQDWPVRNDELQRTALERLESLAKRLDADEARRLRGAVHLQQRRDLVVKLLWQGEADLDLKVEEPSGSICTALNRQTVGGGTLTADALASMTSETYAAAQAFTGEYRIWVERVWGRPLGNKAQLKIIRYQGTKDETEQLLTVKLPSNVSAPVVVKLDNGRRTETAYVPPPAVQQEEQPQGSGMDESDAVLSKLRSLADPEVTGFERGVRGGMASSGRPVSRPASIDPRSHETDRTLYQNRVQSFVANSVDVTAQAVLSADRRSVRLSITPVFNTAQSSKPVQVVSPVFPGAPAAKD